MASDSARREDHFQKKICPKRTFPSNFVKLVSKILYLFLAEKMVVCCLFVCFVAIFCPILAYFFKIEAFVELRKMLSRKKIYHARFGNCSTPYPAVPQHSFAHRFAHIFAHIFFKNNEFQKYFSARRNIFDLTQNSVKAVLTLSNLIMIRTYVFR